MMRRYWRIFPKDVSTLSPFQLNQSISVVLKTECTRWTWTEHHWPVLVGVCKLFVIHVRMHVHASRSQAVAHMNSVIHTFTRRFLGIHTFRLLILSLLLIGPPSRRRIVKLSLPKQDHNLVVEGWRGSLHKLLLAHSRVVGVVKPDITGAVARTQSLT